MAEEDVEIRHLALVPWRTSKVPVMGAGDHRLSAPTYSGLASILVAASRRLPLSSASSHQAARSSAPTSRTWVLQGRSAHCRVTPNTFRVVAPDP